MNYKFLVCIIAIICLIVPAMAVTTNPYVRWTNQKGETITSAYVGDVVRFSFDSVTNGSYPTIPTLANQTRKSFYFTIEEQQTQTGFWVDANPFLLYQPNFYVQEKGNSTYPLYYCDLAYETWWYYNGSWSGTTPKIWVGYANVTVGDVPAYRVHFNAINNTFGANPWSYDLGNVTLTVSHNPLKMTNLNDAAQGLGGDGLRYALGALIILVMALIPFIITRQFNLYLEIIMIVLGVGIAAAIGFFDLWVVFGLGIGCLALYLLMNKTGGAQNG
jgi:hypothetical protein